MMEKRTLKNLGISTSLLGFGCMRFPTTADGKIDRVKAAQMLDTAYNAGVNYFDTAYPYHDGESELFVGEAMKKYPRESFFLATKLPCWFVKSLDDAQRLFVEQLEKLQTDYIDFYLLHALDRSSWERMRDLGVPELLDGLKKQGKIKYIGFSFHDDYEVFEDIITYRQWDFCQIQFNYMDVEFQAGVKGYELAEKNNVPIVVMEPIRGGALANLPKELFKQLDELDPNTTPAAWALRWVASFPNVATVLSGMSNEQQAQENIETFQNFKPLSDKENTAIEQLVEVLRGRVRNKCTGCRYCMPCPAGVDIPKSFHIWNEWGIYENIAAVKWDWSNMKDSAKPHNCIECGQCEDACPQAIEIRNDLKSFEEQIKSVNV